MKEGAIQLSEEEIRKLFDFVESKYVRYIDVQHELVDHLASGIEDSRLKNPNLTFDKALKMEYARFPVTGFSSFMADRTNAMSRYWVLRFFKILLGYIKLPKVILTLLVLATVLTITFRFGDWITLSMLRWMKFAGLGIGFLLLAYLNVKKKNKTKYLVLQSYNTVMGCLIAFIPYTSIWAIAGDNLSMHLSEKPLFTLILLSICVSVYLIILHASLTIFPTMLKEEIEHKYKHLNIAIV